MTRYDLPKRGKANCIVCDGDCNYKRIRCSRCGELFCTKCDSRVYGVCDICVVIETGESDSSFPELRGRYYD